MINGQDMIDNRNISKKEQEVLVNKLKCIFIVSVSIIVILSPVKLFADEWYGGVDAAQVHTTIGGVDSSVDFTTFHLRTKLGFQRQDTYAIEAYVMTPDSDTAEFTNTSITTSAIGTAVDEYDTGIIISINGKVIFNTQYVNIYPLLAISLLDIEYKYESLFSAVPGTTATDSVLMYGSGAGLEFNTKSNMRLNFEVLIQKGEVDFPTTVDANDSIDSVAFNAGLSYYF